MRVCGFDLAGSDAAAVILDGAEDTFVVVKSTTRKFTLPDSKDAAAVKDLLRILGAFFREMKVEFVAVKQRAEKGTYAGGATSFKIEGLIQVAAEGAVVFVSPQLISRRLKNSDAELPSGLHKYQTGAFHTALVALQDHG